MTAEGASTDELLRRAALGDQPAKERLLQHYRPRVRQLVAIRWDRRLAARFDPSDVVQEALLEASRKLDEYLREPAVPFYPWLRGLAMNRLIDLHRRHVLAGRRSTRREEGLQLPLPDESTMVLASRLIGDATSPSHHLERREEQLRVRDALGLLEAEYREVLVMRYLEELSSDEIAAVLGVTDRTVRRRHRQGIERLGQLLGESTGRQPW